MKQKNSEGYLTIEMVHDGIPDDELKPEVFSDFQKTVIDALPADRREEILRGVPIVVADMETCEEIAVFNKHNVKPSEVRMRSFARFLYEKMAEEMQDPANRAKFESWKKERDDNLKKDKNDT